MSIKVFISDIGGVLLRNKPDWHEHRKWEEYLGLGEGELFKTLFKTELSHAAFIGKISEGEVFRQFATAVGLDDKQLSAFVETVWSRTQLNTELAQFISDLRPDYRTATLSNGWSYAREDINRKFKFDKLFDLQIYSSEEGLAKPDVRFYQLAIDRLNIQAEEAIFLDDNAENVNSARLIGIHGIHFVSNDQALAEIKMYLEKFEVVYMKV